MPSSLMGAMPTEYHRRPSVEGWAPAKFPQATAPPMVFPW